MAVPRRAALPSPQGVRRSRVVGLVGVTAPTHDLRRDERLAGHLGDCFGDVARFGETFADHRPRDDDVADNETLAANLLEHDLELRDVLCLALPAAAGRRFFDADLVDLPEGHEFSRADAHAQESLLPHARLLLLLEYHVCSG